MEILSRVQEPVSPPNPQPRVRVLVVDDSPVMRRLLANVLSADALVAVVGFAASGDQALQQIPQLRPDVITLDVEMPGIDGIETLKKIRALYPRIRVLMLSSLTERGAPATLKALMHGASDYVAKPQSANSPEQSLEYLRRELLPRVRQFSPIEHCRPVLSGLSRAVAKPGVGAAPKALLIGISTGGPQALTEVLPSIPPNFPLPILIVQHMPPVFTRLLAQRLAEASKIRVEEGVQGRLLQPGLALLAPGGRHMRVRRMAGGVAVDLDDRPPENSCRPAADVLFRSAADVWGGQVLAAVLTGMGQDGLRGVEVLKKHGATVIAQDKASSIVWGMPGAVSHAGLADEVVSLSQFVPTVLKRVGFRS